MMTTEERELLMEVMWLAMMQRGAGLGSKAPGYILEKMRRKQDPVALWQGMDSEAISIAKCYCDKWRVPLGDWLAELGLE